MTQLEVEDLSEFHSETSEEEVTNGEEQADETTVLLPEVADGKTPNEQVDTGILANPQGLREGHVYRLEGNDGYYYYGSTQLGLHARFRGHKNVVMLEEGKQQPVTLHFTALGWDKVTMTSVLTMISTREDLYRAEGEIVREHFGEPKCLNRRRPGFFETRHQRWAREYPLGAGAPVICICGDRMVQAAMTYHLASDKHRKNMILRALPAGTDEGREQELTACECGRRMKRYRLPAHRLGEAHKLRMLVKNLPPQSKIPTPPRIPTPGGKNPAMRWCKCPCGAFIDRRNFTHHLKSLCHLAAMIKSGQIEVASQPQEASAVLPPGRAQCECGAIISILGMREHVSTESHKAAMRLRAQVEETEDATPEQEEPPVAVRIAFSRAPAATIICECGAKITESHLERHLETAEHKARMKRREQGLPSPVNGVARIKEKIQCPCGTMVTRKTMERHKESKKHKAYEASMQGMARAEARA
jgi:hypothetical protein